MKNWKLGINRYTLLYIKKTNNRDLLYSTRNSIQYCVMTYVGKESEKKICLQLNYFAIYLQIPQSCKSTRIFLSDTKCMLYIYLHSVWDWNLVGFFFLPFETNHHFHVNFALKEPEMKVKKNNIEINALNDYPK